MIGLILSALLGVIALLVNRPGVNVLSRESSPPRTPPTDTGQQFAAGVTERGRTDGPIRFTSLSEFLRECGERTNWNALAWDAVEAFFAFGGAILNFSRIVGPAAVKATANIVDNAAGVSLVITALGEGDWYNGLNWIIEVDPDDADKRRIRITHDTDASVGEASPYYETQAELVAWSLNSRYIRLAIGAAALIPAAGNGALAGGTDDRNAITDADRVEALLRFDPDLGPGQVSIPGATTQTAWDAILEHAEENNRDAILDYPDTADEATLTTLAATARGRGRAGAGFAGWIRMPHIGGLTKLVPPALAVAGRIASHDAATAGWGQNKPVAGQRRGQLPRALGVSQEWPDADVRKRLNAAGVNLIRERFGGVVIYGWRSLAPEGDVGWTNFGHRRLQIALTAKLDAVMEGFVFEEIDGKGVLLSQVNGAIKARVVSPYYDKGSLYGATPEEAYRIDTDSVNTPETIQNKELHASLTVVESEFAEEVTVEIVKKLITEGVG